MVGEVPVAMAAAPDLLYEQHTLHPATHCSRRSPTPSPKFSWSRGWCWAGELEVRRAGVSLASPRSALVSAVRSGSHWRSARRCRQIAEADDARPRNAFTVHTRHGDTEPGATVPNR